MKKMISMLLLATFILQVHAQNADEEINAFFEKVNSKLTSIKTADFKLVTTLSTTDQPIVDVVEGYYALLPADQLTGCKYFIQEPSKKIMYDGKFVYYLDESDLYIVDAKKYPQYAGSVISSDNPLVFHQLINKFLGYYGATPDIVANNKKYSNAVTKISQEKIGTELMNVITCQQEMTSDNDKSPIKTTIILYVTKDYLPVKQVTITKQDGELIKNESVIEKYNILETLPESKFPPVVLGKYTKKSHYQGEAKGYVEDKK